jgi:membrane fusion protein, multidrug efflux system
MMSLDGFGEGSFLLVGGWMVLGSGRHPVPARLMFSRLVLYFGLLLPSGAFAQLELAVAEPKRGSVVRYVTLPGSLVPLQQATLHAKTTGFLKSISCDKGDAVKAGALLAELECPELEADLVRSEAESAVLKPALEFAQQEYDRLEKARKSSPDLILPQMLEKAKAELDRAKAAFDVVAANAKKAGALLAYTKVVAPFSGVVTQRFVDAGALVPAGTSTGAGGSAVVTVMDFSTLRAQVAVPEVDAAFVTVGQPLLVSVEGLPGKSFASTVKRMSYALDPSMRTMLVEAELPNAELTLRPGMYATIKVGVQRHDNALLIPVEGLVMEKAAAFVFLHKEGKAVKTAITLGFNDGVVVEVAAGPDGKLALDEGAQVLLVGKATLAPDQAVKIKP